MNYRKRCFPVFLIAHKCVCFRLILLRSSTASSNPWPTSGEPGSEEVLRLSKCQLTELCRFSVRLFRHRAKQVGPSDSSQHSAGGREADQQLDEVSPGQQTGKRESQSKPANRSEEGQSHTGRSHTGVADRYFENYVPCLPFNLL